MGFPELCERWLAGTTRPERERYVEVLEAHRGASVEAARSALAAADLGASNEVLDELAMVVSTSPVFDVNVDGSGAVRFSDGTKFGFKKLGRFGGSAKF